MISNMNADGNGANKWKKQNFQLKKNVGVFLEKEVNLLSGVNWVIDNWIIR